MQSLSSATRGSAELDLSTITDIILKEGDPAQRVSTGIFRSLPQCTVGLILGRSSLIAKGITVQTGMIDFDYEVELIVLMFCKGL
jgi:dUTPase